MILVADENVDRPIVEMLRYQGHSVKYVAECAPGIADEEVLGLCVSPHALLITTDKDFGELVFRDGKSHCGVLLLRFMGLPAQAKAERVVWAVKEHGIEMTGGFAVLSPSTLRMRPLTAIHFGLSKVVK